MSRNESSGLKTLDLVYIALFTVVMAICSWISIPTAVPFTLQTFAVFCLLEMLGGKRGTICICVYILLAAIGAPVLAGFKGGMGALLGLTGGYILGFVFIGLLYWLGERLFGKELAVRIITLLLGLVVCYAFGTAWFMAVYAKQTGPIGIASALAWCVLPFIIPDLVKLGLAAQLAARLRKTIDL